MAISRLMIAVVPSSKTVKTWVAICCKLPHIVNTLATKNPATLLLVTMAGTPATLLARIWPVSLWAAGAKPTSAKASPARKVYSERLPSKGLSGKMVNWIKKENAVPNAAMFDAQLELKSHEALPITSVSLCP
jgi:hypothetical protein